MFALHVICVKVPLSALHLSGALTGDEPAMSTGAATEVDFLVETDSRIVDQVRKDLSQAYLSIMSKALQAGRVAEQGEAGSCGKLYRSAAVHMNAIMSPIPTTVYKPATVTPRQTSAMTLSGWSLISLPGTALLHAICPTQLDRAGGG